MGMDRDGTNPVEGNEVPSQRAGHNWDVDEAWIGVVAEVEHGQVEEVHYQDEFSPDEMRANEEHDPGKLKEVVENEVASNIGCVGDIIGLGGEEMPYVSNLEDVQHDPSHWLARWREFSLVTIRTSRC